MCPSSRTDLSFCSQGLFSAGGHVLAFLLFFACTIVSFAQSIPFTLQNDSLLAQPLISFGFDKTGNTFLFRGDAYGSFAVPFGGSLFLKQRYSGRSIRTDNISVRDEEECSLLYRVPVAENLDANASASLLYSSDVRAANLSNIQDIAVFGGMRYRPWLNTEFNVGAGGVRNGQLGISEGGWRLIGTGNLTDRDIDSYILNADARGDYSVLGHHRTISHSALSARLFRTFETGERMEITTQAVSLRRDQYLPVTTFGSDSTVSSRLSDSVETRSERQLRFTGLLVFPFTGNGELNVTASVENISVDRYYQQTLVTIRESAVTRTLDELRFALASTLRAEALGGYHELTVQLESREEQNTVSRRYDIGDTALSTQRLRENLRDNSAARSSLAARAWWELGARDTIRYSTSTALLRYDTPSAGNDDDRDEFSAAANVGYSHRFSPLLSVALTTELQMTHIVFLKATRSAQNNWNRIIRFSPIINITGERFTATPRFEVVANYTSYDFDDLIGARQSISSRQVGYADSIVYRLTERHRIESRLTLRYEERGEFRWATFSEIPTYRKTEQFYTVLFFTQAFTGVSFGAGGRYYELMQKQLTRVPSATGQFRRRSIGPETIIEANFLSGSTLRLHGWYEFQFADGSDSRRLANLQLDVQMPL